MNKSFFSKILLVFPPLDKELISFEIFRDFFYQTGPFPPLGLVSLANYLKDYFPLIKLKIVDGQLLSMSDIIQELVNFSPDIVGISPLARSYHNALSIARKAKEKRAIVVMGGHHVTGLSEKILLNRGPLSKDYCLDVIVQYDGEKALRDLVAGKPYQRIPNLIWIDKKNNIRKNRLEFLDLEKLPQVDWNLANIEEYFKEQKRSTRKNYFKRGLSLISKKGCLWRIKKKGCIFCSRMDIGLRSKSPINFWQEVFYLNKNYQTDFIWDVRDDFLDDISWLEELVEIKEHLGISTFQTYARIDSVNKRIIKILDQLGLPLLFIIGFESGSKQSLKTMNKGFSPQFALKKLELLSSANIRVAATFVLGAPNETKESLRETLKFANKLINLGASIHPHILEPLPNSRAYNLLMSRSKYNKDEDLLDLRDLVNDWVNKFCKVDFKYLLRIYQRMVDLNNIRYKN